MWEWGVLPIWGIHSVIVQPWQRTRQDQDFPGNSLPTRWVFRCYFTGDSKGGFQSLVQNHSSKSQILANLHFTIWLVWPVSGSDLLKHVQDTGAGGGDLNFAYLDRPPPPNLPLIQLRLSFTASGLCFQTPVLAPGQPQPLGSLHSPWSCCISCMLVGSLARPNWVRKIGELPPSPPKGGIVPVSLVSLGERYLLRKVYLVWETL